MSATIKAILGTHKGQCVANQILIRHEGKNMTAATRVPGGDWQPTDEYKEKLGKRKAAPKKKVADAPVDPTPVDPADAD